MKGCMDRVHKSGPWAWGPCFVYVQIGRQVPKRIIAIFNERPRQIFPFDQSQSTDKQKKQR